MAIERTVHIHEGPGGPFESMFVADQSAGTQPGLLLFPNVVIVHFSVDWWRSLHQTATITRLDPTIEGTMLFTLVLGIAVFGLVSAWLLVHRFRVSWLEERVQHRGLDDALSERRAEAGLVPGGAS